jgi:hypothetical protein
MGASNVDRPRNNGLSLQPDSPRELLGQVLWPVLGILLANFLFKRAFTPPLASIAPFGLVLVNAEIVGRTLAENPAALLLPFEYEPGRFYWAPTVIVPLYSLYKVFQPFGAYLVTSSLLIVTGYLCSWIVFRSRAFSATFGLLVALGTQLSYALTLGNVLALYVLLSYISVNLTFAACLVQARKRSSALWLKTGFVLTLVGVAVGNEMWLNYAVPLIIGAVFTTIWAWHHRKAEVAGGARFVAAATSIVLAAYLSIRLQAAGQYLTPSAEEELVLAYPSVVMIVEDVVANFFTLLYMTLSNYLPSFLFFSTSYAVWGEAAIIEQQHGYHPEKTHLVVASHLFLWRFGAGVLTVVFVWLAARWLLRSWRSPDPRHLILVLLAIGVLTGFSTHLLIKMRPYNGTPMLTYKAMFSVFSFTLLLSYAVMCAHEWFGNVVRYRAAIVGFWLFIALAAMTRPMAMNAGLAAVGLSGHGDPIKKILKWTR